MPTRRPTAHTAWASVASQWLGAGDPELWERSETEDEGGVEADVGGVGADGDPQGRAHVLHAAQGAEGGEEEQGARETDEADAQVEGRGVEDGAAAAHAANGEVDQRQQHGGGGDAGGGCQQQGEGGDAHGAVPVAGAGAPRHFGLGAHGEEVEDPHQAGEQRRADAEGGHRGGAEARHEGGVGQARQGLGDHRGEDRQGQRYQGAVRALDERVVGCDGQGRHGALVRSRITEASQ